MTTTTDVGLEIISDILIGNASGEIDALAIGTAANTEATTATTLGSEVFRASESDSNVELIETGTTGKTELVIRVKGDTDVSAGTEIKELAVFINGVGGGGTMMVIDNFNGVVIETGHTEEFTIPFSPVRAV